MRGHQVRKNYKKITWSVGILEKVILRWRRKGSGLRGFRSEARTDVCRMQDTSSNEDDYDFLKEGRKQTEEGLKKALARVKSMVQYPEARDQYSRLLNVVAQIQETKVLDFSLNFLLPFFPSVFYLSGQYLSASSGSIFCFPITENSS